MYIKDGLETSVQFCISVALCVDSSLIVIINSCWVISNTVTLMVSTYRYNVISINNYIKL